MEIPLEKFKEVSKSLEQIILAKKAENKVKNVNLTIAKTLIKHLKKINDMAIIVENEAKEEEKEIIEMIQNLNIIESLSKFQKEDQNNEDSGINYAIAESTIENEERKRSARGEETCEKQLQKLVEALRSEIINLRFVENNDSKNSLPKVKKEPEEKKLEGPVIPVHKKSNKNEEEKKVVLLPKAKPKCLMCQDQNRPAFLLKCKCAYCIGCLGKKLIGYNPDLFCNTFDAHKKKQQCMCVCPTHKVSISLNILTTIFGTGKLETYSLIALKKQLKSSKYSCKIYRFNKEI